MSGTQTTTSPAAIGRRHFPSPLEMLARYGLYVGLTVMIIIFSILNPAFLTSQNILNLLQQTSTIGIMAIGVAIVVIAGGIDISVGSVLGLGGMIAAIILHADPASVPLAILAGLAVGAGVGFVNGIVITRLRVSPFITTLATLSAIRGIVYIVSNQFSIRIPKGSGFSELGQGHIGPVPVSVVVLIVVAFGAWIFESRTTFGRSIRAVGGNEMAARLSGLRVTAVHLWTYVISGICAAIAGIIITSQVSLAVPYQGNGAELDVLAAVIVGGISLKGGVGTVWLAVVGAVFIGVLYNGMALSNVQDTWQMIIAGGVIVAAAGLYTVAQARLER